MASSLPPVKNAAFTFDMVLISQADTDVGKTSPTLAAGDITISKDGGDFANITTLPTQIQTSGVLPVALTATEMNADRITVRFHDAAGDEWQDALVSIYTAAQTFDTTDGVADTISGIVGHTDYGNAKLMRSATPANKLATDASGRVTPDTVTPAGPSAADIATEVDTVQSAAHGAGAWGAGAGAFSKVYTVTVGGVAAAGAYCRRCTDAACTVSVSAGTTNSLGQVTFWHNLPVGTAVWVHVVLSGNETLIDAETI